MMKRQFQVLLAILLALAAANKAHADVCIVIDGSSTDLVVTVNGSLDVTGAAAYVSGGSYNPGIIPGGSGWYVAPGGAGAFDSYFLTSVSGPFGTSTSFSTPDSSSGDSFFINGAGAVTPNVGVAAGYVSGDAISSQMTFLNTSLADLTLSAGTYNFSLPNDQIKMIVSVPEPNSFFGFGIFYLASLVQRRKLN